MYQAHAQCIRPHLCGRRKVLALGSSYLESGTALRLCLHGGKKLLAPGRYTIRQIILGPLFFCFVFFVFSLHANRVVTFGPGATIFLAQGR